MHQSNLLFTLLHYEARLDRSFRYRLITYLHFSYVSESCLLARRVRFFRGDSVRAVSTSAWVSSGIAV